uniref:Uncharacterized protein n=1 Tax=Ditylenchus dipsaci TaxID=166011 RepID=A0A915CKI9_9BILA
MMFFKFSTLLCLAILGFGLLHSSVAEAVRACHGDGNCSNGEICYHPRVVSYCRSPDDIEAETPKRKGK